MTIATTIPSFSAARHTGRLVRTGTAAAALAVLAPAMASASVPLIPCDRTLLINGPEPGVRFNGPRGIAYDPRNGEVWVANSGDHRLDVFDLKGRRRFEVIHRVEAADGNVVDGIPLAIAITPAGQLLVIDALASYVDVLDYRGRSVGRIAAPIDSSFAGPGAIAVSPSGGILIASRGRGSRVLEFAPDFTSRRSWGSHGSEPGQLEAITALAWLRDDTVLVCCQGTELAAQIFTADGEFVRGWGRHDIGEGNFSLPSAVAVTGDGRIWISDQIRKVIQVFDSTGTLVGLVGGSGTVPVEFLYPSALATDGDRLLAVAESVGNRFQTLKVR